MTDKLIKKIETISELTDIPVIDIMDWSDDAVELEYTKLMERKENI